MHSVSDLGEMRPCARYVMRPRLTWALTDRPTQAVNSIIMSGIVLKQNAFKFKIAPHNNG